LPAICRHVGAGLPAIRDAHMRRTLIAIGVLLVLAGFAWPWLRQLPLGRLPGDIVIDRGDFKLYFPIVTMLFVSIVLSLLLWLLRR
jgi:DUF2905 family protein